MSGKYTKTSDLPRKASRPSDAWWQSLDEYLSDEYAGAPEERSPDDGALRINRRDLIKLLGASIALAGLGGCGAPADEEIVPYVHPPLGQTEGEARHYATAVNLNGYASGVLATSYMGRPVKLEGNPAHPLDRGRTNVFTQAAILQLWDPERSSLLLRRGVGAGWDELLADLDGRRRALHTVEGEGLHVLSGNIASPTLLAQLDSLQRTFPRARWHQYEPICDDSVQAGARLAFGEDVQSRFDLSRARCVLSLDADLLGPGPEQVTYARQFADARRSAEHGGGMLRLYAVETDPTLTGAAADHRRAVRNRDIETLARALAQQLGAPIDPPSDLPVPGQWLQALAADLKASGPAALVVAGRRQPPAVHALAHWLNQQLGAAGRTVFYQAPVVPPAQQMESLRELVAAMHAGHVDTLLILDANPVYSAPADLDVAAALAQVPLAVHLGLYADETAAHCRWHVPAAHELESWGDACAADGTVSIRQPLIAPLYGGHSAHELLAVLNGDVTASGRELVRNHWRRQWGQDFDARWKRALRAGFVADSAVPRHAAEVRDGLFADLPPQQPRTDGSLEIAFAPDPTVWDGRFANNAWLQELPKPLTQLTWDNAALLSPATASALRVNNGQILELRYGGNTLRAPAWIAPGHADDSVTLTLGYGRRSGGALAAGPGVNANLLRRSTAPWSDGGLQVRVTDARYDLATTQVHHRMHERHLVREATLDEFQRNPRFAKRSESGPKPSLYAPYAYDGHAWAMSVNLNTCIGCGACTIACQAENNIPVVGKEQVRKSREMHWIRVDRYYKGPVEEPETYFQPVPCMHCEHAPCEVVCPVGATVHDSEGLNVQVYNRCIGTRFCSNNCPYKVRRFNFLQYADRDTPGLKAQRNPEVTVRMRGVMEKCTYCIQRIERARIAAQRDNRDLQEGDIVTACQQVCPTGAIVFGDLNAADSEVRKAKQSPLDYDMLEELNTRPRTSYTAKLRNPNPALRHRRG